MVYYRLYLLGIAGHVEKVHEIEASDDAAAVVAAATKGKHADRMELWCGSRLVEEWLTSMPHHDSAE